MKYYTKIKRYSVRAKYYAGAILKSNISSTETHPDDLLLTIAHLNTSLHSSHHISSVCTTGTRFAFAAGSGGNEAYGQTARTTSYRFLSSNGETNVVKKLLKLFERGG